MPGATENNTGGQWAKRVIEKRMEEAKIEERKGKLRKVLTPLEEEALAPGELLIRQSLPLFPNSSCKNVDKKNFPPALDKTNWDVPCKKSY